MESDRSLKIAAATAAGAAAGLFIGAPWIGAAIGAAIGTIATRADDASTTRTYLGHFTGENYTDARGRVWITSEISYSEGSGVSGKGIIFRTKYRKDGVDEETSFSVPLSDYPSRRQALESGAVMIDHEKN